MIQFTIPGPPTGKARARITKFGAYTPEKTVNYETLVKEMFAIKYPNHKPYEGEVWISVGAYFSIPKSATKGKRLAMQHNIVRPTKKPDADNILKIIGDALNGLAYKDDSQIVGARIHKRYTDGQPYTEVEVLDISANSAREAPPCTKKF